MIYENTNQNIKVRNSMGKWMKEYSLTEKGKDWDYCVGLTYRSKVIKTETAKKNWISLYKDLNELDNSVYGFVVDELDEIGISIHHHLIIGSELDEITFKKVMENNWNKRGVSWVKKYIRDNSWDYCDYMCKHIHKTNRNVFDIFSL